MKLLDLFSGTQSVSSVFREKGWETYTIDFNKVFTNTDWQIGTQGLKGSIERSKIPKQLCEHIHAICEEGEI